MKQDLANVWHARFHFKEQSLHDLLADAECYAAHITD